MFCYNVDTIHEWLIEKVMAMYEFSNSTVKVNNTVGSQLNVKVGVPQGSVLSPLLFIIVIEALSREFKSGLVWELLCADDLVIIAENLEELEERYSISMESKYGSERSESQHP